MDWPIAAQVTSDYYRSGLATAEIGGLISRAALDLPARRLGLNWLAVDRSPGMGVNKKRLFYSAICVCTY
jgi:hypothetical protein